MCWCRWPGAAITIAVIVEASGTAQVVGAIWPAMGSAVRVVQRAREPAGAG